MGAPEFVAFVIGWLGVFIAGAVITRAWQKRTPKHVHQWSRIVATQVDTYGDGWGGQTKRPVKRHTDIAGQCRTCDAPLFRRVDGAWSPPPRTDTPLRKSVPTKGYRMSDLCPRCGVDANGVRPPFCTDAGHDHVSTCATYTFSDDLCADCTPSPTNDSPRERAAETNEERA